MRDSDTNSTKFTITPDRHLFWFIQDGKQLDLNEPSELDMYVQQVITRGGTEDVKGLLKSIDFNRLTESLKRIENFLHDGVRGFWEDYINGSYQ